MLKTWYAAGFAVAVIEKDKVIYAKGFGYRDVAGKKPVTLNTMFPIGSCSKAFTSAMIRILQKDGKLDIDKPVNNYLPALKFYNDALTSNVTLRDMMSHRTGLPRFDMSWYFLIRPPLTTCCNVYVTWSQQRAYRRTYFSNYGFGWFVNSYKGHYRVEHGGVIDGFSANTSFFPADSIGIVVLSNQSGSKVPNIVRNILADRILHLPYENWNTETKIAYDKAMEAWDKQVKENTAAVKHNATTHQLPDFAGRYTNPAYGSMQLFVERDSLFARTVTHTLWLRHANYDTFEVFDTDPEEGIDTSKVYGIHMNTEGDIDGFKSQLESGLKPCLFGKEHSP